MIPSLLTMKLLYSWCFQKISRIRYTRDHVVSTWSDQAWYECSYTVLNAQPQLNQRLPPPRPPPPLPLLAPPPPLPPPPPRPPPTRSRSDMRLRTPGGAVLRLMCKTPDFIIPIEGAGPKLQKETEQAHTHVWRGG